MKRIKRVFTNSNQVLHLWANQAQDSARCGNVFFEGNKVYSYGYHYELGRIIEYNGHKVAMINSCGYSMTTSKHIRQAESAARHLIVLSTKGDLDNVQDALERMQSEIVDDLTKHFSRRHFWGGCSWKNSYIREDVQKLNNYCDALGFSDLKLNVDQDFIDLFDNHIKLRQVKQKELDAHAEERKAKRQAQLRAKLESDFQEWIKGGNAFAGMSNLEPQGLRIKGDEVQTTRGASVPLEHAKRLLTRIMSGQAKSGERVGHFQLNSIKGDVVKVGCHTFSLEQVKSILGT